MDTWKTVTVTIAPYQRCRRPLLACQLSYDRELPDAMLNG
jgi:hypothetical protein